MLEVKIIIPGVEELAAAINNLAGVKVPITSKKKETKIVEEVKQVSEEASADTQQTEEETPRVDGEVIYTLVQVREKLTELSRAGKAKEVKKLLTELGASNVSTLDASKYAEAMERAGEL